MVRICYFCRLAEGPEDEKIKGHNVRMHICLECYAELTRLFWRMVDELDHKQLTGGDPCE